MDALEQVAKQVIASKSLKARNISWLTACAIVDLGMLLFFTHSMSIPELLDSKLALQRAFLSTLLVVPLLFLSYFVPQNYKHRLVFWRWEDPLPGSRAFTLYAPQDDRIDIEALRKNVGPFPTTPREQNALWYRLYKEVITDVTVVESHQNFLLFRDIASMSLVVSVLTPAGVFAAQVSTPVIWTIVIFFILQYVLFVLPARNCGVRMVQNVLAIHASRKTSRAPRARSKKDGSSESKSTTMSRRKAPDAGAS
jgi:hypothetical protein